MDSSFSGRLIKIFNYTKKLQYISWTYNFGNKCYYHIKKYTVMPDGKIFFSYYNKNGTSPCHKKIFYTNPLNAKLLYFKIRFLIRHANCNFTVHNDSGSRIKLFYRLRNQETAHHGLSFGILGNKTPVSKIITTDAIMKNFIRKHCYKTFE